MKKLSLKSLLREARDWASTQEDSLHPALYAVTDGKAVGTHLEREFKNRLHGKYRFGHGNAAAGIDFPGLNLDMKATSIRQPQSSCPYKSARQKVYGLGYGLLVFAYEKSDDHKRRKGKVNIRHSIYIEPDRTGDYQTTRGILEILDRQGNEEDLIAFFTERNLPVDEIGASQLAEEVMAIPSVQGYLTVSNALQWRLQYGRAIGLAGEIEGVRRIR